jgi:hypothetical protein
MQRLGVMLKNILSNKVPLIEKNVSHSKGLKQKGSNATTSSLKKTNHLE